MWVCFFFQAEDGIRDADVTGVQTCALPISVDTPVAAVPEQRAGGGHVHPLRVGRVDRDRADGGGGDQPDVLPAGPVVGGLVDAVALVRHAAAARVRLPGADVDR